MNKMLELLMETNVHLYKQIAFLKKVPLSVSYDEDSFTKMIQKHYIWPILWTLLILVLAKIFFTNDGFVAKFFRRGKVSGKKK